MRKETVKRRLMRDFELTEREAEGFIEQHADEFREDPDLTDFVKWFFILLAGGYALYEIIKFLSNIRREVAEKRVEAVW